MRNTETLTILMALQYDKVQFDDDEKCLVSDALPLKLYMGQYKSSNLAAEFEIPGGGFHYLFCSLEFFRIWELLRNFHISSHLNNKTVPILFTAEKDTNNMFGYSCYPIHAGEDEYDLLRVVDDIYDMCLENAGRNESEKQLLIVFVVGLSQIKLFSDVLLYEKHIERPELRTSTSNPFEAICSNTPDMLSKTNGIEKHENKAAPSSLHVPVEDKITEMLSRGKEFGITFVFGEKTITDISALDRYPIKVICLDGVATTDIITGRRIVDSILPWKPSPSDEVRAFLYEESPKYRANWDYSHVDF